MDHGQSETLVHLLGGLDGSLGILAITNIQVASALLIQGILALAVAILIAVDK